MGMMENLKLYILNGIGLTVSSFTDWNPPLQFISLVMLIAYTAIQIFEKLKKNNK